MHKVNEKISTMIYGCEEKARAKKNSFHSGEFDCKHKMVHIHAKDLFLYQIFFTFRWHFGTQKANKMRYEKWKLCTNFSWVISAFFLIRSGISFHTKEQN